MRPLSHVPLYLYVFSYLRVQFMLSYQIHDTYTNILAVVMTTTVSHYPSQETTGDGLIPRCHAQRDGTGMWIVAVHHQPF